MPLVKVNGVRIAYEEKGKGDPLLLIMGLGTPGSVWEKHLAVYARHFRCIVIDNRGTGRSEKPKGPYSIALMADDAAGLLDRLGVSSARVAGISMGSAIAQELALRYPARVRSMVLVSSWARCDTYLKELLHSFQTARETLPPGDFMRLIQLWIYAPGYFNSSFAGMEEAKEAPPQGPATPRHAYAAHCDACSNHDTLGRLHRIGQPCLLTVGEKDIFTPVHLSQAMASRLPHARLKVFRNAGHCHHWESLDAFNAITVKFLLEH